MGGWLRKMSTPFRRVWGAIFSKLRRRKHMRGSGNMNKLYNDVRACGYEDVHVMWSMLHHQQFPVNSPKKHRMSLSFG